MPPRTRKKNAPRRRKFRGIRPISLGIDIFQANALTEMVTRGNIVETFIKPFTHAGAPHRQVPGHGGGTPHVLDVKEIFDGLMGQGLFKPGVVAHGNWVGGWLGTPNVADVGLGGVIMNNIKEGAIPAAVKIVGSNVVKKVITKSGVTRSLNKLTRQIGFSDLVRW